MLRQFQSNGAAGVNGVLEIPTG